MVVDRGGLRYPIEVIDQFSGQLQRFRDEVRRSREEFARFRKESAGTSATRNSTKATRDLARSLSVEDEARTRLARRIRENKVQMQEEATARRLGLQFTARQLSALKEEDAVRRHLARTLERERVAAEAERLAKEKGLVTSKARAQAAREEAAAKVAAARKEAAARREAAQAAREAARQEAAVRAEGLRSAREAGRQLRESEKQRLAALRQGVQRQAEVERFRSRFHNQAQRDRAQVLQSLREEGTRIRKLGELDAIVQQNRARGLRQTAQQTLVGARNTAVLGKNLQQTESAASRLLFTFRRLVGVLAIFTAARVAAGAFAGLVRSGFEFNQTVERSRLGIAGILVAVTRVRNEQGKLVEGAEAFAIAQGEARRQQRLLRQDALDTTATFQELLDAFQVALGPGLAAGLNIDQVRRFSVLISQAASNIGLQQNQLSEEIRAILTGNIRATTTRIAQVLNLTNEQIRELKAQGPDVFFRDLQERLQGFALGAQAAAQTVGGLFVRLKDVVELVAGNAARNAFEELRGTLQDLFDALTVREETEFGVLLRPDPKAQQAFEAIFEAIERILQRARQLGQTIGLEGVTDSAQALALVLEVVGTVLVDVIAGIVRGVGSLKTIFEPVIQFFSAIGDLLPTGAANELLVTFVQIATVMLGMKVAFAIVAGTAGRLVGIVAGLPTQLGFALLHVNNLVERTKIWVAESKVGAAVMKTMRSRAFLMAGGFVAAVKAVELIAESILGIDLQLQDLPELFGTIFEQVFTKIIALGGTVFTVIRANAVKAFNNVLAESEIGIKRIKRFFDLELSSSDSLSDVARREFEHEIASIRVDAAKKNAALEKEIAEQKNIQKQQEDDANKRAGERIAKLKKEVELREKERKEFEKQLAADNRGGGTFEPKVPGDDEVSSKDIEQLARARERLALRRNELELRKELLAIDASDTTQADREVQAIKAKIEALQRERAIRIVAGQAEVENFEKANAAVLEQEESTAQQKLTQEQLNNLKEKQRLKEEEINLELAEQEERLRRAKQIAEGSAFEGLGQGLQNFVDKFSSSFLTAVNIIEGIVEQTAGVISKTLSDALDPNANSETHKENFQKFLKGISDLIIEELTKLAIAKLLIEVGLASASAHEGGSIGKHGGGRIPSRATASAAHYGPGVQGLTAGGVPRHPRAKPPKGVHPKDTVPLWAEPGEFMMRVTAVRKYGTEFMSAINQGLIDPSSLPSLAGARRLARSNRRRISYQSGGEVGEAARSVAQAASSQQGPGASASAGATPAYIVANDQSLERLLHGGRRAMLDFVDQVAPDIEASLARYRRQ